MAPRVKVSWQEINSLINRLSISIKAMVTLEDVDSLYGIPRGGLIPAVMLSHWTGIPLVTNSRNICSRTLIVDDICDTGKALQPYLDNYIAVLYNRSHTNKINCTFMAQEIKHDFWLVFPWESE